MATGHAVLPPSDASRWVPCPASVKHQAPYPNLSNASAEEGSAIHEVAAKVLQDFIAHGRKGHTFKRADFLNTVSGNGVLITDEMLDVAEMYIRDVISQSLKYGADSLLLIEHRVYMPVIHAQNWGTLDNCNVIFSHEKVIVSDLKAGWGIVEVWDNWQLLDYGVGILLYIQKNNLPMPRDIEFRIIQPRPSHPEGRIRSWTLPIMELEKYVGQLQASAHDAMSDNPTYRAGKHCNNCRGAHSCPMLARATYAAVEAIQGISPIGLTPPQVGDHLLMLESAGELIKALFSALEDQALQFLRQGKPVRGWEGTQKESRRYWTENFKTVTVLGQLMGVELRKEALLTPLQAIKAGVPEETVKLLSKTSSGEYSLQKFNGRRSAKVFEGK